MVDSEVTVAALTERLLGFCQERDWNQFHNAKDLALSLSLEAAEVLELMQWRNGSQLDEHLQDKRDQLGDELADVLYWTLLLAYNQQIDLVEVFERKMVHNEAKYPVEKAKGSHAKYTEL